MKRFLCILLCLLLMAPAALAEGYTPTRLFRQQFITGGNGLRGTVAITASGVAPWLDLLLPFTASKLQVRIIGEAQGAASAFVTDDEDWQAKLWAKDAQGNQQGLTYVYGNPDGVFFSSDLLPGTLLTLPVRNVNLPYQLSDGKAVELFTAFNPLQLPASSASGNVSAWSALGQLFSIEEDVWNTQWAPVVAKYETLMDMWMADYATPTVLSGSAGSMTLRTAYEIPADALKEQMKYMVSLIMSDGELLNMIYPLLTEDQRSLYLNPALTWFYGHCIDIAPITGTILLERETTTLGETTAMTIALPVPELPDSLTVPLGELLKNTFRLPYADAFAGVDRVSIRQAGEDLSVSLNSPHRTITLLCAPGEAEEGASRYEGFLRITPAVGNDQPMLSAAFVYEASQSLWEDDEYNTHEDFAWSLELTPDMSLADPDDLFYSTCIEFAPLAFTAKVGYTMKDKAASPVQLAISVAAVLADAEVTVSASLKVAERWAHDVLPTTGAEDVTTMSDERLEQLRTLFVNNATQTMMNLNAAPAQ